MKTLLFLSVLLWVGAMQLAFAGSAAWSTNPVSGDWNTAANWMPNTVPNSITDEAVSITGRPGRAAVTLTGN